jgi:hypothetical protein
MGCYNTRYSCTGCQRECTGCQREFLLNNTQCTGCGGEFCPKCATWWDGYDYSDSCREEAEKESECEEEEEDDEMEEDDEYYPGHAGYDYSVGRWRDENGSLLAGQIKN